MPGPSHLQPLLSLPPQHRPGSRFPAHTPTLPTHPTHTPPTHSLLPPYTPPLTQFQPRSLTGPLQPPPSRTSLPHLVPNPPPPAGAPPPVSDSSSNPSPPPPPTPHMVIPSTTQTCQVYTYVPPPGSSAQLPDGVEEGGVTSGGGGGNLGGGEGGGVDGGDEGSGVTKGDKLLQSLARCLSAAAQPARGRVVGQEEDGSKREEDGAMREGGEVREGIEGERVGGGNVGVKDSEGDIASSHNMNSSGNVRGGKVGASLLHVIDAEMARRLCTPTHSQPNRQQQIDTKQQPPPPTNRSRVSSVSCQAVVSASVSERYSSQPPPPPPPHSTPHHSTAHTTSSSHLTASGPMSSSSVALHPDDAECPRTQLADPVRQLFNLYSQQPDTTPIPSTTSVLQPGVNAMMLHSHNMHNSHGPQQHHNTSTVGHLLHSPPLHNGIVDISSHEHTPHTLPHRTDEGDIIPSPPPSYRPIPPHHLSPPPSSRNNLPTHPHNHHAQPLINTHQPLLSHQPVPISHLPLSHQQPHQPPPPSLHRRSSRHQLRAYPTPSTSSILPPPYTPFPLPPLDNPTNPRQQPATASPPIMHRDLHQHPPPPPLLSRGGPLVRPTGGYLHHPPPPPRPLGGFQQGEYSREDDEEVDGGMCGPAVDNFHVCLPLSISRQVDVPVQVQSEGESFYSFPPPSDEDVDGRWGVSRKDMEGLRQLFSFEHGVCQVWVSCIHGRIASIQNIPSYLQPIVGRLFKQIVVHHLLESVIHIEERKHRLINNTTMGLQVDRDASVDKNQRQSTSTSPVSVTADGGGGHSTAPLVAAAKAAAGAAATAIEADGVMLSCIPTIPVRCVGIYQTYELPHYEYTPSSQQSSTLPSPTTHSPPHITASNQDEVKEGDKTHAEGVQYSTTDSHDDINKPDCSRNTRSRPIQLLPNPSLQGYPYRYLTKLCIASEQDWHGPYTALVAGLVHLKEQLKLLQAAIKREYDLQGGENGGDGGGAEGVRGGGGKSGRRASPGGGGGLVGGSGQDYVVIHFRYDFDSEETRDMLLGNGGGRRGGVDEWKEDDGITDSNSMVVSHGNARDMTVDISGSKTALDGHGQSVGHGSSVSLPLSSEGQDKNNNQSQSTTHVPCCEIPGETLRVTVPVRSKEWANMQMLIECADPRQRPFCKHTEAGGVSYEAGEVGLVTLREEKSGQVQGEGMEGLLGDAERKRGVEARHLCVDEFRLEATRGTQKWDPRQSFKRLKKGVHCRMIPTDVYNSMARISFQTSSHLPQPHHPSTNTTPSYSPSPVSPHNVHLPSFSSSPPLPIQPPPVPTLPSRASPPPPPPAPHLDTGLLPSPPAPTPYHTCINPSTASHPSSSNARTALAENHQRLQQPMGKGLGTAHATETEHSITKTSCSSSPSISSNTTGNNNTSSTSGCCDNSSGYTAEAKEGDPQSNSAPTDSIVGKGIVDKVTHSVVPPSTSMASVRPPPHPPTRLSSSHNSPSSTPTAGCGSISDGYSKHNGKTVTSSIPILSACGGGEGGNKDDGGLDLKKAGTGGMGNEACNEALATTPTAVSGSSGKRGGGDTCTSKGRWGGKQSSGDREKMKIDGKGGGTPKSKRGGAGGVTRECSGRGGSSGGGEGGSRVRGGRDRGGSGGGGAGNVTSTRGASYVFKHKSGSNVGSKEGLTGVDGSVVRRGSTATCSSVGSKSCASSHTSGKGVASPVSSSAHTSSGTTGVESMAARPAEGLAVATTARQTTPSASAAVVVHSVEGVCKGGVTTKSE
eukprot:GHVQ01036363.1.p1 GENE.GHVQ01036363.1~~GHVQ01036363.1.p1  ORF type:complete len:1836 (-),score=521.49 GHVQ01036363.1:3318-8573(-)